MKVITTLTVCLLILPQFSLAHEWEMASGATEKGTYHWEFYSGQMTGYGSWSDGNEEYVGFFVNGKFQGLGTRYRLDGTVLQAGRFERGVLVKTASSLPTTAQADLCLIQAKKLLSSGDFRGALVELNSVLALGVSPPIDFYYHLADCNAKSKDFSRAVSNYQKYVVEAGSGGEYYVSCLEMLSAATDSLNAWNTQLENRAAAIRSCGLCFGKGEKTIKVNCEKCNGKGRTYYECHRCDGRGRVKDVKFCWSCLAGKDAYGNRCLECGGDCAIDFWKTCPECNGTGKKSKSCSDDDCEGGKKEERVTCKH